MHVFLYEWATGGGLVEEPSRIPPSLLIEGTAMLSALARDFSAIEGSRVTLLRDIRLDEFEAPDCEVIEIHSRSHHAEEMERTASEADFSLILAPEIDNVLAKTVANVRAAGGNLLAPSNEFVSLTSDKERTAQRLHAGGVPVPSSVLFDADEQCLPADFRYPAVLKPVHGAGSQNTLLVSSARDEPPPYPWARRLEEFCSGIPASVSFLCGPEHRVPLAAFRQHLSEDGRFTYLGGSILWETDLAERAHQLADRALAALPPALGYVGVDLVLGNAPDGSEDIVFEINPRLTTSYVGLRAATKHNLASAMLENFAGRTVRPEFRLDPLEFSVTGAVRRPVG